MPAHRIKKLFSTHWHVIGVIVFFVLHGYSRYVSLVPFVDALFLLLKLLAGGLLSYWICKKIYRHPWKAGIAASFCWVVLLFFGLLQDWLAANRFLAPIAGLSRLVTIVALLSAVFFIWLRKTRRSFYRTTTYINVLLTIYLLVDIISLAGNAIFNTRQQDRLPASSGLQHCADCPRPSVYLVILDEYIGLEGLKELLGYASASFPDSLRQKGFHIVPHSRSNYYLTVYSMASLLNMKYLRISGPPNIRNHYGYKKAMTGIRDNIVCSFFAQQGYRVVNYSDFDLSDQPAHYSGELAGKVQLITSQTLYRRIGKALPAFLNNQFNFAAFEEKAREEVVRSNEEKMRRTLEDCRAATTQPVFTYLHLTMPHAPFAFDSTGRRTTYKQQPAGAAGMAAYLQYLVYTNRRITTFIDQLQQHTQGKAVILLMSDHGVRAVLKDKKGYRYQTLNAVYMPEGNYAGWYAGMSHVNQFRVLFNTLFGQQLPLLADSAVTR